MSVYEFEITYLRRSWQGPSFYTPSLSIASKIFATKISWKISFFIVSALLYLNVEREVKDILHKQHCYSSSATHRVNIPAHWRRICICRSCVLLLRLLWRNWHSKTSITWPTMMAVAVLVFVHFNGLGSFRLVAFNLHNEILEVKGTVCIIYREYKIFGTSNLFVLGLWS